LTYGYFMNPAHHLYLEAVQRCGLQIARRPTGGGLIFHLTDWAFSVLIPAHHPHLSKNTLENYAWINRCAAQTIACFTSRPLEPRLFDPKIFCQNKGCSPFCMEKPTQYDVIINGKKVGGAAQRRTKRGLLHQGSLSLRFPPIEFLLQVLKEGERVAKAMRENSFCLLAEQATLAELMEARFQLKQLLISKIAPNV
jgi:lipoate---protein ligase